MAEKNKGNKGKSEPSDSQQEFTIEDMATFCKAKGIIYPTADLYGGLSGFFDYGHLGVDFKNNIKQHWWKTFVQQREDVVGIDGSIITNPRVWQASGHVACFEDVMVECKKCKHRVRADQLIEQKLDIQADGLSAKDLTRLITKNKVGCPECKGTLGEGKQFNLMFSTLVGPVADEKARSYLRPETAQLIFTNFRYVTEHARLKVPFGIAQIGKAFRNEISPRDFLFRCRELEQMELEYFIHPSMIKNCPFLKEVEKHKILVYSAGMQDKKQNPKEMTMKDAVGKKLLMPWHAYWLTLSHQWFVDLGAIPKNFRIRQHLAKEKSHYAIDTWDLEYKFPFGWKELQGMANRTDFDLKQHAEHSKTDLSLYDEESKKKFFPHVVAEPAQGVERAMLVFLFDAYHNDKKRGNIVLKLHPLLAPVKVGVFPLTNKIKDQAKKVYDKLKQDFHCTFDRSGSVGRRYARADETGIPLCVTFDFESLKDKAVTLRDRDTTKQVRVPLAELPERIALFLMGKKGKGWK